MVQGEAAGLERRIHHRPEQGDSPAGGEARNSSLREKGGGQRERAGVVVVVLRQAGGQPVCMPLCVLVCVA